MSNKSLFEKLFEDVMKDDAEMLGIGAGAEEGAGTEEGGMGGDEMGSEDVTISMDRETAQKLHDLLASVLGGDVKADEEMAGEEGEGEGEDDESYGDESAEDGNDADGEDTGEEDSEEGALRESPQVGYKDFPNKGDSLQKKDQKVAGALATKVSGAGKATQTSQTQGTEKYMPMKTNYNDGKSNQVSSNIKPSGAGSSVFHR